ncbi:hypothetical protein [Neptuniibacter sp. QD37_11]|uniref:hypothetical protein n=1 Tax=Neptuniibacter sp. QD37_11 TaxID=3398209 RepID=UPI0039F5C687
MSTDVIVLFAQKGVPILRWGTQMEHCYPSKMAEAVDEFADRNEPVEYLIHLDLLGKTDVVVGEGSLHINIYPKLPEIEG